RENRSWPATGAAERILHWRRTKRPAGNRTTEGWLHTRVSRASGGGFASGSSTTCRTYGSISEEKGVASGRHRWIRGCLSGRGLVGEAPQRRASYDRGSAVGKLGPRASQ